jgi:uncharacterized protein (DUF952 family)
LKQGCGEEYYPPTYKADGFIHATKDPVMLIGIANHFYKASSAKSPPPTITKKDTRLEALNPESHFVLARRRDAVADDIFAAEGDWVLLHLSEAKLTHEVKYEVI